MRAMPIPSDRSACIAELKRQIGVIERDRFDTGLLGGEQFTAAPLVAFDPPRIDPFLAGDGRAAPALYELVADGYGSQPSVRNFALALTASLLHRRMEGQSMVLWCQRQRDALEFGRLYGPGLQALGLPPERFLMVTGKRDADCLWAMEQGLASRSLLAVIGTVDRVGLIASRRLSLAAAAHQTFCFLLPIHHGQEPSAARTRWRIRSAPSSPDRLDPKGLGTPAWHLDLERSPHGQTGRWAVEWNHAAYHFHLASQSCNQPAAERTRRHQKTGSIVAFERAG